MEEFLYVLNCLSCDVRVQLKVIDEEELPAFCPMCGEDVNEEWSVTN
jgi:uncharacterized paraquat-inducible protein A